MLQTGIGLSLINHSLLLLYMPALVMDMVQEHWTIGKVCHDTELAETKMDRLTGTVLVLKMPHHEDTAYFDNGNYAAGGILYDEAGEEIQDDTQLSKNILRESVNEHTWWGIISTFNHTFKNKSTLMVGIDGRSYVGRHFRRVRNLIGGDYWFESYSNAVEGVAGRNQLKNVGDKIAYDNDGLVRYGGAFAQWEITMGNLSVFAAGTVSNTWYGKIDRYNYVSSESAQVADFVNAFGYNAKAGLNFNINEKNNVFLNLGYYSRAPYWDFVFVNLNPKFFDSGY